MDGFMMFKKALQKHFDEMQKEATHLFEVNVDKDELWNTYLDSFPAGTNEIFRERTGIAEYLYIVLRNHLPIDEMMEDYEVTKQEVIDEIECALDEIL